MSDNVFRLQCERAALTGQWGSIALQRIPLFVRIAGVVAGIGDAERPRRTRHET